MNVVITLVAVLDKCRNGVKNVDERTTKRLPHFSTIYMFFSLFHHLVKCIHTNIKFTFHIVYIV